MMRERKFSSCTLETGASGDSFLEVQDGEGWSRGAVWEVETVSSSHCSHDSGFISHPGSSSWALRFPGFPEEEKEDVHTKDRRNVEKEENNNVGKPDLLDCLIQEDLEERLEQMKRKDASPAERILLDNLMKLLELQIQLGGGQSSGGGGGSELCWPQPQLQKAAGEGGGGRAILGVGRASAYPAQVSSLNSFLEQEVPLTFPGQLARGKALVVSDLKSPGPVKREEVKSEERAALPSPAREDQRKPGGRRTRKTGGGRGQVAREERREEMLARMEEVTHQLVALGRERKECEKELAQRGAGSAQSGSSSGGVRNSEILKLSKLLGDVRAEHERILVMVRTLEVVNNVVHSKSLHDNLSKWRNSTIDLSIMMRSHQRGGEGSLTSEIVRMGQSMRRIRTLLWTLTASLPSQ